VKYDKRYKKIKIIVGKAFATCVCWNNI